MTAAVRMEAITKRYPRVVANQDAQITVEKGEVHAVVGENGAGKSTLMKILYGLVRPDEGRIEVLGKRLHHHGPREAIAAGVGMVFQHFMLVPPLTVAENIVLGREPTRGLQLDLARAASEVKAVSERFKLAIDPSMRIADCSVGLQQRVEILKVLHRGAEVIILDEPTAVLTPQEVDELIAVIRGLAEDGKSIVIITHKLREVMAVSDRVTIMRQGRTVETVETARTTAAEIAEKMVGREIAAPPRQEPRGGAPVLSVRGLTALSDRGLPALRGVDLEVKAGEIVGVAGIEGNGQTELIECIVGLRKPAAGTIALASRDLLPLTPRERLEAGLAHIAEDRHKRAVVLDMSVEENAILGAQRGFAGPLGLDFGRMRAHAEAIIAGSDVRPPDRTLAIRALSGGNQQKVVVGRELARKPRLLLAAHPTRGLDVGAIEFVQRSLLEARRQDCAIVLVSAELPELLALSDRIVVMYGGAIAGEVLPQEATERDLGLMMAGQGRHR